jgi:hypothetical protein
MIGTLLSPGVTSLQVLPPSMLRTILLEVAAQTVEREVAQTYLSSSSTGTPPSAEGEGAALGSGVIDGDAVDRV